MKFTTLMLMTILATSLMSQSTKLDYTSKGDSLFQIIQTTTFQPTDKEGFRLFIYDQIIKDYDKIAALQWEIIQLKKDIGAKTGLIEKAGLNNYEADVDTLLKATMNGRWLYRTVNSERLVDIKQAKIYSEGTAVATVAHKSRLIKEVNFNFFNMTSFVVMVSKDGSSFQGTDEQGKVHFLIRVAADAIPTN